MKNQQVRVIINGNVTGIGVLVKKENAGFKVSPGHSAVNITEILHPIAKLGIWQFPEENIQLLDESYSVIVRNSKGEIKWRLNIVQVEQMWKVEENTKYSLFPSDCWSSGKTPGEALDAFLKVSEQLLENLGHTSNN